MIAPAASVSKQRQSGSGQAGTDAKLRDGGEYAMLMVDGTGRICGCAAGAEDVFGADRSRLLGKRISAFIADLFREASSPSFNARYFAHLGADGAWRRFKATDARGRGFAVELSVSAMVSEGRETFVIALRRPGDEA